MSMVAIGLWKPYPKLKVGESYTCTGLLTRRWWWYSYFSTGLKYPEYISRIRILNNNQTTLFKNWSWLKQSIGTECLAEWKKKNRVECKNIQSMHNVQYSIPELSLKDSQGGFCSKLRGIVWIESTQIRWFLGQTDGRLDLWEVA